MLNYETILSSYDDKMTLMQWLKKVEEALKNASATAFKVNKKGEATLTFEIDFEDGTKLESGEIVLQQGETGPQGPQGETGPQGVGVVSFSIDANNHLIVTFTNGTTQDIGNIISGNIEVNDITCRTIEQTQPNFEATIKLAKQTHVADADLTEIYNRFQLFNRRLSIIVNFILTNNTENDMTIYTGDYCVGRYQVLPSSIASKIFDIAGNSVAQANAGPKFITAVPMVVYDGETSTTATEYRDFTLYVENNNNANTLWLGVRHFNSSFVFKAGKSYYFTARIILDL